MGVFAYVGAPAFPGLTGASTLILALGGFPVAALVPLTYCKKTVITLGTVTSYVTNARSFTVQ